MALLLEPAPQVPEAVELAVVGDPDGTVLVGHGLVTRWRGVEDGQTAIGEARVTIQVDALVIRAAMREGPGHDGQLRFCRGVSREVQDPRYSAHRDLILVALPGWTKPGRLTREQTHR